MTALFEFLVDAPEDGYIEEHGWLRGDLAETPEAAVEKMTDLVQREMGEPLTWADEPATFQVVRKVSLRAELTVYDEDGEDVESLVGDAAEKAAAEGGCEDELRYVPCDPDDDGAALWWKLALVTKAAA